MDEYITRNEQNEMIRRIEAEDDRQNHRIDVIEDRVNKLIDLQVSMAELQVGISNITDELRKLASDVEMIKKEPADKWNKAVWIVVTALLTAAVTFFLSRMGV